MRISDWSSDVCSSDLVRLARREEGLQLEHVLREAVGGGRRAPQRLQGRLVGAGRAPQAEVDAAGEQLRQGAELLGDDVGSMVRQHDAARADAKGAGAAGDVSDEDRKSTRLNSSH